MVMLLQALDSAEHPTTSDVSPEDLPLELTLCQPGVLISVFTRKTLVRLRVISPYITAWANKGKDCALCTTQHPTPKALLFAQQFNHLGFGNSPGATRWLTVSTLDHRWKSVHGFLPLQILSHWSRFPPVSILPFPQTWICSPGGGVWVPHVSLHYGGGRIHASSLLLARLL